MQRIACTLITGALGIICALVALLLSDALAPGRVPPMLAFYAACLAGALLILGLVLLERWGAPHNVTEARRGFGPLKAGQSFSG